MGAILSLVGINWRVALPILAAIAFLSGAYLKGHHDAAQACTARGLAAQLAEAKAQLTSIAKARADGEARETALAAGNMDLARKVSDYAEKLKRLPAPSTCPTGDRLSADDVVRLRGLGR